jgi:hypothetical protein
MEYGIYFNNDSANKTIGAALEELENMFFIENSTSESEKNILDNHEIISDEEITSINKTFENLQLSNFEFAENSNNYIEDNVHDDLKLKVKEVFEKGKCLCHPNCFKKIGYERFLARRAEFKSLDKTIRDMVIKGQLMAFQKEGKPIKNNEDKKYSRFNFRFNDNLSICRIAYLALVGVNHKYLDNIKEHLQKYGLEERTHGNTGKTPKNKNRIEITYDLAYGIREFLKNYGEIHGIPSPGRKFTKFTMPVVFLPTSFSYASVYRDYVEAYKDEHGSEARVIAKNSFINVWKSVIPSLQFMSPKSDLCETCEKMKMDIQYATEQEKKLAVTENYLTHLNHVK